MNKSLEMIKSPFSIRALLHNNRHTAMAARSNKIPTTLITRTLHVLKNTLDRAEDEFGFKGGE